MLLGWTWKSTAWMSMYNAMHAQQDKRPVLPRDAAADPAASPGRTAAGCCGFLVLTVVGGGAGGRDAGARRPGRRRDRRRRRRRRSSTGSPRSSPSSPSLEAGLGLLTRWLSATHRRGPDPRPAHGGLRPRAADAGRVLHPHPHRRAGQPAQQRRHRRAARVQRHPVRRGRQPRDAGADARRDARASPGRSRCSRCCCCRCSSCRPGGWAPGWPGSSARRPTTTRRWARR